jgi:hypothetical protein
MKEETIVCTPSASRGRRRHDSEKKGGRGGWEEVGG